MHRSEKFDKLSTFGDESETKNLYTLDIKNTRPLIMTPHTKYETQEQQKKIYISYY